MDALSTDLVTILLCKRPVSTSRWVDRRDRIAWKSNFNQIYAHFSTLFKMSSDWPLTTQQTTMKPLPLEWNWWVVWVDISSVQVLYTRSYILPCGTPSVFHNSVKCCKSKTAASLVLKSLSVKIRSLLYTLLLITLSNKCFATSFLCAFAYDGIHSGGLCDFTDGACWIHDWNSQDNMVMCYLTVNFSPSGVANDPRPGERSQIFFEHNCSRLCPIC